MFLLGLLLAACAAAFAALLIAYNTSGGPEYTVTMFDNDMVTLNSLAIFCAGLALGLIFSLGMLMMGGKARMSRSRRNRDRRAVDSAALERENAEAREAAARARERAANAEARADHLQHEPGGDTTWSSDPATQPQTPAEPGGSHTTRWNEK
ncbi:hypothetical protein [Streptomyces sp. SID3343]|uniref:hypothetical protein n=1 Tax=Streptomyces sp. SID3343 TaxID=2690260 RepID=UPI00136FB044|nr:hypothetical protein [Streptomyces sp. SID3343]MYV97389.1 hypothetical protein [Streptomyces sp. SID3343]